MVEVTVHVIDVHVNDSAFHFDVHGLFIGLSMICPTSEVAVEPFTERITYHIAGPVLVAPRDLVLLVSIESLSVGDCNIHFILDCTTCQLILGALSMLSEHVEHGAQKVLLIMLPKCDSCHIGLNQMPVVRDMVLPCFQILV